MVTDTVLRWHAVMGALEPLVERPSPCAAVAVCLMDNHKVRLALLELRDQRVPSRGIVVDAQGDVEHVHIEVLLADVDSCVRTRRLACYPSLRMHVHHRQLFGLHGWIKRANALTECSITSYNSEGCLVWRINRETTALPCLLRKIQGVRQHAPPLPLAAEDEQQTANDDGADTDPHWHVDGLLFLGGHLERADLHNGRVLRVAEPAINEAEDAADDEDDCYDFDWIHGSLCRRVSHIVRISSQVPLRRSSDPTQTDLGCVQVARRVVDYSGRPPSSGIARPSLRR